MKDLSLHVLDVGGNSIAVNAPNLFITLEESDARDLIRIEILDDGIGMDEETAKKAIDPFFTTRTTRSVGLGLSLLKAKCELCEGTFSLESEPGKGTKVAATLRKGNIDVPPIGDMGLTIVNLMTMGKVTDVHYTYIYEDSSYSVSTPELVDIIGEREALLEIDVMNYVSQMINENTNSLKTG